MREASGLPEVVVQGGQHRRGDVLNPLVEDQVVVGGQLDQPLPGRHQPLVDQTAVVEGEPADDPGGCARGTADERRPRGSRAG